MSYSDKIYYLDLSITKPLNLDNIIYKYPVFQCINNSQLNSSFTYLQVINNIESLESSELIIEFFKRVAPYSTVYIEGYGDNCTSIIQLDINKDIPKTWNSLSLDDFIKKIENIPVKENIKFEYLMPTSERTNKLFIEKLKSIGFKNCEVINYRYDEDKNEFTRTPESNLNLQYFEDILLQKKINYIHSRTDEPIEKIKNDSLTNIVDSNKNSLSINFLNGLVIALKYYINFYRDKNEAKGLLHWLPKKPKTRIESAMLRLYLLKLKFYFNNNPKEELDKFINNFLMRFFLEKNSSEEFLIKDPLSIYLVKIIYVFFAKQNDKSLDLENSIAMNLFKKIFLHSSNKVFSDDWFRDVYRKMEKLM